MIFNWSEIEEKGWKALLLGNGFSIGISSKFRYDSLLSQVDALGISMYPHARSLFSDTKIGTSNFEEVLKVIYHAYLVNFYNLGAIKQLYNNVQKSLIEAVQSSHVSSSEVPTTRIANILRDYDEIYTTNYDLIPYWSMADVSFSGFCDFFWHGGCEFNLANVGVRDGKTPIYYLHGAVHLKSSPDGTIYKVTTAGSNTLSSALNSPEMGNTPLFISEGSSDKKLRKIRSNYYLNFCYENFIKCKNSVVIFGHGLDKDYDEHILKALKASPLKRIAISVYSGLGVEHKKSFASCIRAYFAGTDKDLYFFESSTHPLSLR